MIALYNGNICSIPDYLNERIVTVKRKYTDLHPAHVHSTYDPVRNKILEFINERGIVTHHQLKEFLHQFTESTGRKTSFGWVKRNSQLIKKAKNESNDYIYSLTERGRRILKKTKQLMESINDYDYTTMNVTSNQYYTILGNILKYENLTEFEFYELIEEVSIEFGWNINESEYNDVIQNYFYEDLKIEINNLGEVIYTLNEASEIDTLLYLMLK